jgi:hypothetical protein
MRSKQAMMPMANQRAVTLIKGATRSSAIMCSRIGVVAVRLIPVLRSRKSFVYVFISLEYIKDLYIIVLRRRIQIYRQHAFIERSRRLT